MDRFHTIDADYLSTIVDELEASVKREEAAHGEVSYLTFALLSRLRALTALTCGCPDCYGNFKEGMRDAIDASDHALSFPCVCELTEDINAIHF